MKLQEIDLKTTGGKIRQARVEAGLTSSDIALMVKLPNNQFPSVSYILRVERGEIRPSFDLVKQIAKITKKSIDFFTGEEHA